MVAGGSHNQTEQVKTRVTTANRRVCSGNLSDGGEEGTVGDFTDPRCHVEIYMKRWRVTQDGRRFRAVARNG